MFTKTTILKDVFPKCRKLCTVKMRDDYYSSFIENVDINLYDFESSSNLFLSLVHIIDGDDVILNMISISHNFINDGRNRCALSCNIVDLSSFENSPVKADLSKDFKYRIKKEPILLEYDYTQTMWFLDKIYDIKIYV